MNDEAYLSILKKNTLFHNLTDEQILQVLNHSEKATFSKGETLIHEGEMGYDAYLILEGQVEISKQDLESGNKHMLSTLGAGETIGEMALIDKSPRSASALALEESKVLVMHLLDLASSPDLKALFAQIVLNISEKLSERLRKTSDLSVSALQAEIKGAEARLEVGQFLFLVFSLLSVWVFVVTVLRKYTGEVKFTSLITIPMLIVLFVVCGLHVKISPYPLSYFGIHLRNWKRNLAEGILFSMPVLLLATLLKWLLVLYVPAFKHDFVVDFNFFSSLSEGSILYIIVIGLLYLIFTPIQEFVARGVLQSSIKTALSTFRTSFWPIVLSNTIFAAFHAHISGLYSLAAFVGGCFWGWLYARQRSLIGPTVSHLLVGLWCIVILRFGKIFTHF